MLRSLSTAVLALALATSACGEPSVGFTAPTGTVVNAVFDPTKSAIPLPNDLVFLAPVNSVCASGDKASPTPVCAQADLLYGFSNYAPANAPALAGAFPNDQEVSITIDFTQTSFAAGKMTQTAPDLDFATFTSANFFVLRTSSTGQIEMPLDPLTAADYVTASDGSKATLTVHNQGRKPWPPGAYVLVMRGGPSGVKTKTGDPVNPSDVFDLLAQDVDLTDDANLGLLRAQAGSLDEARSLGKQLDAVRLIYGASVFPVADKKFPHQELAIATSFQIGPTVTNVVIDPATGQAPLPIDLLRDLGTGKLSQLAACTLASAQLDASGKCTSPAAAGFLALDGFSTTGAILGPTSDLIRVGTITKDTLQLWDLSDKANPVQVDPSTFILEPCEFTSAAQANGTCTPPATALSPVIAIQPAGATAGDPMSVFRTKPLKDSTDYAVVMTTGIQDKSGAPLGSGSAARLLKFFNPIVVGGHAAVPGLDDATAAQLEDMRGKLKPVLDKLTTAGIGRGSVAIAYTFHTQTILSQAVQLAALPYSPTLPPATALPGPVSAGTAAAAFTRFGVPAGVPNGNIDEILEADITTFNALNPVTGAFLADPSKAAPETIHVLIVTPKIASATVPPACSASSPLRCAPLMIFRHGLSRGRLDALLIADTFAGAGMVTVAIDAAKHGDRSLCSSNPAQGSITGCAGACTPLPNSAGQGDPIMPGAPGTCDNAGFVKRGLDRSLVTTVDKDGIPVVSGNYLISANFFRTRDTLRQDVIDQSQLVRVMAFNPPANVGTPPATGHTVFDHMVARGVIIDPATIYFSGQSLGAIQGTLDVATNPRISKAGLNVGGGTITDIFTTSPAFSDAVNPLLAQVGIQRGTAKFLQFLVVAKTVLDPADPVNFAGHLTANTLPNLLPPLGGNPNGSVAQVPKKILIQVANCDQVVPNPMGLIWASNIELATKTPGGPLPVDPTFFVPNTQGTFQLFVGKDFNPLDLGRADKCTDTTAAGALLVNGNPSGGHGFLLSFENSLTPAAQASMASFMTGNPVPSVTRAQ